MLSLFLFSAILPLFISRVARYTPSSQRRADEKNETNLVSIHSEHLLTCWLSGRLHHIQHLLFDLLELIFHLHHDVLHLGLIAF